MRIAMVANWWYRRGGLGAVVLDEAGELPSRGVQVIPFASAHPQNLPTEFEHLFPPFFETADLGAGMSLTARSKAVANLVSNRDAAARFDRLLGLTRPDLVHLHGPARQLSPSILRVANRRGIPVVMTLHDYSLVCPQGQLLRAERVACQPPNCLSGNVVHAVRDRCVKRSLPASTVAAFEHLVHRATGAYARRSVLLVAPSTFVATTVASAAGIPPARIRVIPNGIEWTPVPPPVGDEGGTVLYAGRLAREKGIEILLDAANRLPSVPFVIAGDGPLLSLRDAAPPNVQFVGQHPPEALAQLRVQSTIAVSPSTWYENAPITVLESLRAGRPVIASDIGGQPELLSVGGGILVPPADSGALAAAIHGIWVDRQRARQIGEAGRQVFEQHYTLSGHVDRLVAVYREAIGLHRSPRASGGIGRPMHP